MRSGRRRGTAFIDEENVDQALVGDTSEDISISFLKELIKLHSSSKNHWFIVPIGAAGAGRHNALESNRLLSRLIGMSDEAFARDLFMGIENIEDRMKYLKETFDVQVVKLQMTLSFFGEEKGMVEAGDSTMLFINFQRNAAVTTYLYEHLSESPVPTFCEESIEGAKIAISKGNLNDQNIVTHFMKHLKKASKPNAAWYLLFSQNANASSNDSYTDIKASPRLLSNMIGAEPHIFSAEILKKKKRNVSAVEFLKSEYGIAVVQYRKVHQLILFGDDHSGSSWMPNSEDLLICPGADASALANQRRRNARPTNHLTPVIIPDSSNADSNRVGSEQCVNVVSPTNSDCSNIEPSLDDDFDGSGLASCKEVIVEKLVSELIGHAAYGGGTTVKEFQESKQYRWNEIRDSNEWSRLQYVKEKAAVIKPILHAWLQQDPKKLYQLVSHLLDDDENVQQTFQHEFIAFVNGDTKTVKGFSNVLGAVIDRVKEHHSTVDTDIADSIREFLVALKSKGTRPTHEQQAVDATITALVYENDDEEKQRAIMKRLGITRPSAAKAKKKVVEMNENGLKYTHSVRAKRMDCKEDKARPYVSRFCHSKEANRAAKVDTGDFQFYTITNENGFDEEHARLRWIDCATKEDVYKKWKVSDEAAEFKSEYPEMESICETVFWKVVCPCCKFGTNDQCSDQIMSGFEEARDAMEKAFKDNDNQQLGEYCDRVFTGNESFQSSLRQQGEEIIESTLCPRKEYTELTKMTLPVEKPAKLFHLDCVHTDCPSCGINKKFREVKKVMEEKSSSTKPHPVNIWVYVPINNTSKTQKELVEKELNTVDLFHHFLKCLDAARTHYVMYKIVDWTIDLFKYNGLKDEGRAVVEADFAASPDLYPSRTATGQVHTHAVVEPFIIHENRREENGLVTCTKRSHIYIGGCEGIGKNNDWQFHFSCVYDTIDRINERRRKEGRPPLRELVVITDRCPSQYLCRQNFLQIAKSDTVIRHVFACKHRFKGDHDAEGGVVKKGNKTNVMRGESGTTPFDFYQGAVKHSTLTEEETEKKGNNTMNLINSRDIFFVVYDREKFNDLNKGENKGKIVLANMNNHDDTKAINGTHGIYMVNGFGVSPPDSINQITDCKLRQVELQLDKIANINQGGEENEDFFRRVEDEEDLNDTDQARLDFIRSKMSQIEFLDELQLSKKRGEKYFDEFLTRIGQSPLPKTKKTKILRIQRWFLASKIQKVYLFRSKKSLVRLYNKELMKSIPEKTSKSIRELMEGIFRIDLSDIYDEDEGEAFFLRASDLSCACPPCLSGDVDNCISPFRHYMRTRIVRLKQIERVENSTEDDDFDM